jgi:L-threonylcarbamoyladenylate synthase
LTTKIFRVSDISEGAAEISQAAEIIKRGGTVAIPTETVYGLGANGLDEQAVKRIFTAKGRPQDNPLILHVADESWIERYCEDVPQEAYLLTRHFWPGPLTIILKRRSIVPSVTTAGLPTVGMRCPKHPITNALIKAADVPIAAPSANISGRPSTTSFAHVLQDMDGKIDAIIDGGDCVVGLESTIIDLTEKPPRLLRPGGVTLEELRRVLDEIEVDEALLRSMPDGEKPKAPGMKYRHYAPRAQVTVVCGYPERAAQYIRERVSDRTGVLCFDEYAFMFDKGNTRTFGRSTDLKAQAERLFDALRSFDDSDVTEIYAQCPSDEGLGLAIANRLKKAAGFRIVDLGRD